MGGDAVGQNGREKNISRKKTAKPHKKALKGERAQARRREKEETGGGRTRKDEHEAEVEEEELRTRVHGA